MRANLGAIGRRRTPRLLGSLALALVFALLVSASADARPAGRLGARDACTIALEAASGSVAPGSPATLNGTVTCEAPAQAQAQSVTVYEHTRGTPGSDVAGTVTPQADGVFSFTSEALEGRSSFYARLEGGARSARVTVQVTSAVTLSGSPAGGALASLGGHQAGVTRAGRTVTFSGAVTPAKDGARVVLQREDAGEEGSWRTLAVTRAGANGEYTLVHTFGVPGVVDVRVLAYVHGMGPTSSPTLTYEIARGHGAALTVQASADPIAFGQSLTLSGLATGAAGQTLTLLASTGGEPAPVANTTVEADGSYAFTALSPQRATRYKLVGGAHGSSATLVERVRPTLTAAVSSPSARDGETVTFEGTLAPAQSGEAVYLERQRSAGLGWQTSATATVDGAGHFAFAQAIAGAGTQTFRVIAHAGEGLLAAASTPLEVNVTPSA